MKVKRTQRYRKHRNTTMMIMMMIMMTMIIIITIIIISYKNVKFLVMKFYCKQKAKGGLKYINL